MAFQRNSPRRNGRQSSHSTLYPLSLVQRLLTKGESNKGLSDPTLLQGFYHYLCLNVLDIFNRQNLYGNLTATLSESQELPSDGALCIDVAIQVEDKPLWGRIICPGQTHASFKAHFAMEHPPLLSDPSFKNLPLSLHLEVGSTTLSISEWKKVKTGDFILLDRCTYDLQNHRGTAILSLGSTPLFDARIKEGTVKILEHALIQEEKHMTEEQPPEEELPPHEENSSPDLEEETQDPLWSSKNGNEEILPTKDMPITITVEVSRFQMPLNKVTQLKPGNVLDLSLTPQPNVHLTVGGKRIAKGELVQLGEALGVKILNLGD